MAYASGAEFRAAPTEGPRRRRPTGKAPPLPRQVNRAAWLWLGIAIAALVFTVLWATLPIVDEKLEGWHDAVAQTFGTPGSGSSTSAARVGDWLVGEWVTRVLRIATVVVLVVFRRWRRLAIFVLTLLALSIIFDAVDSTIAIDAGPHGAFGPSENLLPLSSFASTLTLMGYALVPKGPWRNAWFVLAALLVIATVAARGHLGLLLPTDVLTIPLAVAFGVLAMQLFAPDATFPVTYARRGQSAHLDLSGSRGAAIRVAVSEQLGFEVLEVSPFGGSSSAGSTPMRLRVRTASGDVETVFAKLYAKSHLRSDRFYKAWRTIAYGALEDERSFYSVRRLVQYEDYIMLAMLRAAALPVAVTYGFVELAPESEYALVTEFFEGSQEIGDAEIDTDIADQALAAVRAMWDAGVAHRDIKPANLLVWNGKLEIIDVAFATLRPTPWRQAVDLANMMLILGVHFGADVVYEAALDHFHPNEIAEAFAATHGVTIPRQLRTLVDLHREETGDDLIGQFRELAPARRPIAVQRWSLRRVLLAGGAGLLILAVVFTLIDNFVGRGFL